MTVHPEFQKLLEMVGFRPANCIRRGDIPVDSKQPVIFIASFMTAAHKLFAQRVESKGVKTDTSELDMAEVDEDDAYDGKMAATYSLDQIYERMMQSVRVVCNRFMDNLQGYVLLADKSKWLPPEKAMMRRKRRNQQHRDFYPADTKIGTNGLVLPNEERECAVQPHRLMASGDRLREAFFSTHIKRMQSDPELADRGCRIICDMTTGPPLALAKGKHMAMPECGTEVGEDDLLMFVWAMSMTDHAQLVLQSVDRDMLLIALLHSKRFKNKVFLDFTDYETKRYVDLGEMVEALEREGWTIDALVQTAILAGTDFAEKKILTNGIGVTEMFAATKAFLAQSRYTDLLCCSDRALVDWLRLLYSAKFKAPRVLSVAELRTMGTTRCNFPTNEALQLGRQQLFFNYHYWRSLQDRLYVFPKSTTRPGADDGRETKSSASCEIKSSARPSASSSARSSTSSPTSSSDVSCA